MTFVAGWGLLAVVLVVEDVGGGLVFGIWPGGARLSLRWVADPPPD